MSLSDNFVFHTVIWEEINGCIGCGGYAEYVDFKVERFSNYEKVKKTYTSVTFMCEVEQNPLHFLEYFYYFNF